MCYATLTMEQRASYEHEWTNVIEDRENKDLVSIDVSKYLGLCIFKVSVWRNLKRNFKIKLFLEKN